MSVQTLDAPSTVSGARALDIAERDAIVAYGHLSPFQVQLRCEDDGWHIDYSFKNKRMNGGGPQYVIDSSSGEILKKRYEQ